MRRFDRILGIAFVTLAAAWYKVDCTWDDQDYGIIYKYFMTGI